MEPNNLTPMQLELMKMFSFDHSDEYVLEIKKVLCDYYQKKLDNEFERLFENGTLTMEMIENWSHEDMHREMRARRNGKTGS